MNNKIPLFISHLHADKELVDLIHKLIDEVFSEVFDIFNTSGKPPEAGRKWHDAIRDNLDKANVVLVILTPRSVKRDWVIFEAGAAWLSAEKQEKKLIPCFYEIDEIPSVVAPFQGVSLTARDGISELIESLTNETKGTLNPPIRHVESCVNDYFSKLNHLELEQQLREDDQEIEINTEKSNESTSIISEIDDNKLLDVILDFFNNEKDAMNFAKNLKKHSIITKERYEVFLKRLLDNKF